MFDCRADQSVLLVADVPGHIIERIGLSWIHHVSGVRHELFHSHGKPVVDVLRRVHDVGLVHWINRWGFIGLGAGTMAPQVAMIHHLTETETPVFLRKHRSADAITTASNRWKARLQELTGRDVALIPYTVDCSLFRPLPDRLQLRRRQAIDDSAFVIGFVGKANANQDNRKGIELLLDILRAASRSWKDLCLVVVGPGWEALIDAIHRLGIPVMAFEFSSTFETASVYPLMDVLLITSSEEGGPCTLLEAMACGVPCITSDVGHVPEVVADGANGLICQQRSAREYLERICLLRESVDLRMRIGESARSFVEKKRDERVVLPSMDFNKLYAHAVAHFRDRPWSHLAMRRARQAYWKIRGY